jgi:hypothetical protein
MPDISSLFLFLFRWAWQEAQRSEKRPYRTSRPPANEEGFLLLAWYVIIMVVATAKSLRLLLAVLHVHFALL